MLLVTHLQIKMTFYGLLYISQFYREDRMVVDQERIILLVSMKFN